MKDIKLDEKLPQNDKDLAIGSGVWIGAGSVIDQQMPPYAIVVGSKSHKMVFL